MNGSKQNEFIYELLERRYTGTSTVFCTLLSHENWHDRLEGIICAEYIIERIIHNRINLILGDIICVNLHIEISDEKKERITDVMLLWGKICFPH